MMRKMILALAASATLGTAALAPNTASAWGGPGGWGGHNWGAHSWGGHNWGAHNWGGHSWGRDGWGRHGWGGYRFFRPGFATFGSPVYGRCVVPRRFATPWGPRVRWVNRCY